MISENKNVFSPGEGLVEGVSRNFEHLSKRMFSAVEVDDQIDIAETIVIHSLKASEIAPAAVESALSLVAMTLEFDGTPGTEYLAQAARDQLRMIVSRKNGRLQKNRPEFKPSHSVGRGADKLLTWTYASAGCKDEFARPVCRGHLSRAAG